MKDGALLYVRDISQVGDARRTTRRLTDSAGFSEQIGGKAAIIVTELAANIIKHTTSGGEIILRVIEIGGIAGMEMISIDKGPAIANVAEAMRDGFSTAGGSGTGLGAISRMSDVFDIHSTPGRGTTVFSRVWMSPLKQGISWLDHEADAICIPKSGESVGGDGWSILRSPPYVELMVADGLGHGQLAARAAFAAMHVFRTATNRSPADILQAAHAALRATRGAAMAIARIDCVRRKVIFSGIGNIVGVVVAHDGTRQMVSSNGIVGDVASKCMEFSYPLPDDAVVVMHSDGIASHWSLADYPGLLMKHPAVIGGVLFRNSFKNIDDATVLVARPQPVRSHDAAANGEPIWLS